MTPKISVIIPVYNTEKFLRECLDSVLAQTFTDFEVLVINDGSTDRSGEICDEYSAKDARMKVFHKENGGASSARNLGIERAKGEWICFIDSDDWVREKYLGGFMSQISNTQIDLIVQGFVKKFSDGRAKKVDAGEGLIKLSGLYLLFEQKKIHNFGFTVSKFYKKELIRCNKISFPEDFTIAEDFAFFLKYLSKSENVYFQKEHNYFYRQIEGSLSNRLREPQTYFNRYFGLKNILKDSFEVIFNDIYLIGSRFKSFKHSMGSSLFQSILSLYFHKLEPKERMCYLIKIGDREKTLIKDYKKSFRNPFFKLALFFIEKGNLKMGDFILNLYFEIRKTFLKVQGKSIHYKFKK